MTRCVTLAPTRPHDILLLVLNRGREEGVGLEAARRRVPAARLAAPPAHALWHPRHLAALLVLEAAGCTTRKQPVVLVLSLPTRCFPDRLHLSVSW